MHTRRAGAVIYPAAFRDDAGLLHRLRTRGTGATRAFIDVHGPTVARVLVRILGPDPDLPELVLHTAALALREARQLDDDADLDQWAARLAVRVSRRRLHRRRYRGWLGREATRAHAELHAEPSVQAVHDEVYRVLSGLSEGRRIAWALVVLDGLDLAQVAAVSAMSATTVERRLERTCPLLPTRDTLVEVARAQDQWIHEEGVLDEARELLGAERGPSRLRTALVVLAAPVAATTIILAALSAPEAPLEATAGGEPVSDRTWLAAGPTALRFTDGTVVETTEATRLLLDRLGPRGARLVLERGPAVLTVAGELGTWQVDAGPWAVSTGDASVSVDWQPDAGRLVVATTAGSAQVHGPHVGESGRWVGAGDTLTVSVASRRSELVHVD